MKFICMHCSQEMESDKAYILHMETVHQGESQLAAIQKQKSIEQNIPKTTHLPPGIDPSNLPDPTFMETMAEIAKAEAAMRKPAPQLKPQEPQMVSPSSQPAVKKPIELTYLYTGTCEQGHNVATLETDVEWKHFAIAYCLTCHRQEKLREVQKLKGERIEIPEMLLENTVTI